MKRAHDFGRKLESIIENNDRKKFLELPCFPSNCIEEDDIDYVFGTNNQPSFIKSFLENPEIEMKVFGPFVYDDNSTKGSNYIVMYYHPKKVKFNDSGHLSETNRERLWWEGYIETVIHCQNELCGFQQTPFYHGAHLPWAEDY
ncbi:MAG: hypothetical protein WEA82_11490 [Idiomarina sp.]